MARQEKKSFLLYGSYEEQFELLSMEERGKLITAIFQYERTGVAPTGLSALVGMAFSFIREALDRDRQSYQEFCAQQSEKGKKGGRPRKTASKKIDEEKTQSFFEKAIYDNDNDNGNDNENDNDTDNGKDNGKRENAETKTGKRPSVAPRRPTAPPPSESEKKKLSRTGIPWSYIEPRLSRARIFAESHRRSLEDVLLEWWREDQRKKPSPTGISVDSIPKSYDLDDFVNAALNRSLL